MSKPTRLDPITNEPILDHNYDGIEELDNPLPGWWLGTFYIAIVFAGVYFFYYNIIGDGNPIQHEYDAAVAKLNVRLAEEAKTQKSKFTDDYLVKYVKDSAALANGQAVFSTKCASCHGPDGGGLIGPNLTDVYWINGSGKPASVLTIIKDGVMSKGMPAWGSLLSEDELVHLSAYVYSIQGSSPTKPKAPQGNKVN